MAGWGDGQGKCRGPKGTAAPGRWSERGSAVGRRARVGAAQSHMAGSDGHRDLGWALGDVRPGGLIIAKGIKSKEGLEMTRGLGAWAAPPVTVGDLVRTPFRLLGHLSR